MFFFSWSITQVHPSDLKIFRSLFVFWNYQWFILSVHFSDLAQFSWKKKLFKSVTVAFLHLKWLNHEAYEKLQPVEWKWPHKRNLYCFIFFLQNFNVQQILLSFEILPLFTQQRSLWESNFQILWIRSPISARVLCLNSTWWIWIGHVSKFWGVPHLRGLSKPEPDHMKLYCCPVSTHW